MSEADNERRLGLECLRLAADFMQMSRDALNPELQAHCIRMANYWSEQADGDAAKNTVVPDDGSAP